MSKPIGFAEKDEQDNRSKPITQLEIGDTGTKIFGGIISEEYNPKLDGPRAIEVYDEMRKSDSTVKSVLEIVKQPLLAAEWYISPASEDAKDQEIAEFIHNNFFEYNETGFNDTLRQALLAYDFGHFVFEKVFGTMTIKGKTYYVWKKLAPRMPRSIQKWEAAPGVKGITQYKSDGRTVGIPWDKLIVFINDREGDNYNGTSVLRAAYKPWYIKANVEKIDAIALERQGLGVPYAKLPEGATKADNDKADEILENMRARENARVVMPEGYEIGFLDMNASSTRDPGNTLAYHSREIMKGVLAQFLELGSTTGGSTGGSYGLSKDHSATFLQGEENRARWVCDSFRGAIKELVDLNFPGVEKYPKLDFEGITNESVKELADTYAALKNAGAMTAQEADEAVFREKLSLPELDPAGVREPDPVNDPNNDPNPNNDQKTAREPHIVKKNFAEGFSPFRTLTFAEQKVDFESLQKAMNRLEAELDTSTKELLHEARAKYMDALMRAVQKEDVSAIKEATLKVKSEYTKILKAAMREAFELGKTKAAQEIGKATPKNPQYILDQIDIQADAIADDHITKIVANSKTSYTAATARGESSIAALAAADASAADAIDTLTRHTKEILTAGYVNHGRDEIFDRFGDDVYALQRSELLDAATCNFCLSFDNRIVEKDDSIARTGPVHSNCRGIWVAIMKDEAELPKISGVPQSLRNRLGDEVNDVEQPSKPIVKKNSPASKEAKKRPE